MKTYAFLAYIIPCHISYCMSVDINLEYTSVNCLRNMFRLAENDEFVMTVFNEENSVDLTISKVTLQSNAVLQFKCESKVVQPISGIHFKGNADGLPEWRIERVSLCSHGMDYNFNLDLWLPDVTKD